MASRRALIRMAIVAIGAHALWIAPWGSPPSRACAQAVSQDEAYRRLAEEAVRALARREFREALAIFREMHAMAPSARTLWSLGRVYYELQEYTVALDYLEQALVDTRRPLEGESRDEATSLRDRCRALTAEIEIHVVPEDATILIDDALSSERRLRLDPGEHVLRFERAGYESTVRRVVVRGGEHELLSVALVPVAATPGEVRQSGPPRDVSIEVRSAAPGLRLHLQPLAESGSPGPIGPMELICEAPCTRTIRTGLYGGAIARGEGDPALASETVTIQGDTLLDIAYHDLEPLRVSGVVMLLSTLTYGAVAITLGGLMLDRGNPELYDSGWGVGWLTSGISVAFLHLLFGFSVAVQPDRGEIRAAPR